MLVTKRKKISYLIFGVTFTVISLNLVSLFFPALIPTLNTNTETYISDPLTPGAWSLTILVVNLGILYFGILYHSNKLPNIIYEGIRFILNFEISKKVAIITIIVIFSIYIPLTAPELSVYEGDIWNDFSLIEQVVGSYPDLEEVRMSGKVLHVKNFLLFSSNELFDNVRVIPFITSIALLLLTYIFTLQITQKRFAGILSMVFLIQSSNFLRYDTTATYTNLWILFYLLSLYLVYKKWYISPVGYFLGIFSKALTAMFLPMSLFYIYNSYISKKQKIWLTIIYAAIILSGIGIATIVFAESSVNVLGPSLDAITNINYTDFWNSFTIWSFQMRFDVVFLSLILPLSVGLFLKARKGFREANSILILLLGTILSATALVTFTEYNTHPYRLVPVLVFFAIGIGTLFSKKPIKE